MSHNLDSLVCQGMANFHNITISESQTFWNSIYIYGESVNAVLSAGGRRGPCKLVFDKPYDIKVFISEKYQDPSHDNATWV